MMDYIMGMSPWIIGIVALIAAMVGWNFVKSGQSTQVKGAMKIVAVIAVVALMFNLGWLAMDTDPTDPIDPLTGVGGPATWAVIPSSSTNNTTVSGNTILTTFTLTGGAFPPAGAGFTPGTVVVSFACTRSDTSIADAVATAYIVSVPTVTNTTSGITHDLLTKDAQGVYDADFTVSGVASPMSATFPADNEDRVATVSLSISLNAAAVEALAQYGTVSIQYMVGGNTFTHNIMHMD